MGKSSIILLVLAGCGQVSVTPTDAAADSTDADLTAMASVVTRVNATTPAPMIDIVSLRPNNSVAEMAQTDATGHAMIHIYPGGTVTAIFKHTAVPTDAGADMSTVTGVQPNDTLTFEPPVSLYGSTGQFIGQMSTSWPPVPGVAYYYLYTPCGQYYVGVSTSFVFPEYSGCHKNPMTLGYIAFGGPGLLAVQVQTNVNFSNGGATGIGSWAAPQNVALTAAAFPPEIVYYNAILTQVLNGNYAFQNGGGNNQPSMPYSHTYQMPSGERLVGIVQMARHGSGINQTSYDSFTGSTWTVSAPTLLPWMTAIAYSPAAHSIAWFAEGTPSYDGIATMMSWQRQITGPPAMTNTYSWNLAVAPGEAHVDLPQLPAPFDTNMPTLDDQPTNNVLHLVDYPMVDGYKAFRELPSSTFACAECKVFDGTYAHANLSP